ncbi:hypothetical protein B9D92_21825, partial [Mycobacterium tuberculosis]
SEQCNNCRVFSKMLTNSAGQSTQLGTICSMRSLRSDHLYTVNIDSLLNKGTSILQYCRHTYIRE